MSTSPAVHHFCDRLRTRAGATRRGAIECHDLRSLSPRLLLSPVETLEFVSRGDLIALSGPVNGKFLFSARTLDAMRDRVIDFVAVEITEAMESRGADEDRVVRCLERAFTRQIELSRTPVQKILNFAQADDDDDDDSFLGTAKKTAGTLAGAGAAGLAGYGAYKGYQYLKNRGNNGNALPGPGGDDDGSGPQSPRVPGGSGPRTPRDPNSSAENIDVGSGNGTHASAPSLPVPITTAASTTRRTIGNSVVDPLSDAVVSGRKAIASRGSAIWSILRNLPLAVE